ncbi:hypothetical protein [Thalassotalea agariperforans]
MSKTQYAKKTNNYTLDPKTRRARFLKNNSAAIVHGGYSKNISEDVLNAIKDTDLGYEVGVLKGQLSNIATMGMGVVADLIKVGEKAEALNIALSCADRSVKIVPQIQKAIESYITSKELLDDKKIKIKNRWLNSLRAGKCEPSEVAYQFEVQQLGELPSYVAQMLALELKNPNIELVEELYTRDEIKQKINEYWQEVELEPNLQDSRSKEIAIEKQKINQQLTSSKVIHSETD